MNFKKSPFAIQAQNAKYPDKSKDYPTIVDLMRDQKVTNNSANTVHYRRDLDSLGQLRNNKASYKFKQIHHTQSLTKIKGIDFIEGFYKRRIQDEVETNQGSEDKNQRDTIQNQNIFMLERN